MCCLSLAPGLPTDVDDTAKCIICLSKLGKEASPAGMIDAFEGETHFRTYASERNPSFTANCNVLSALLAQPDPSHYSVQILKIVNFLCDCWWESDESVKDKWVSLSVTIMSGYSEPMEAKISQNLSSLYASLLAVQAFGDLFMHIEKGSLGPLNQDVQSRVHVTLFQACLRTLLRSPTPQSVEQTAYRVLILCEARRFSLFDPIRTQLEQDIEDQVRLLRTIPDSELESDLSRIWIEKVSFSSQVLIQSYKVAALNAASHPASKIVFKGDDQPAVNLESGKKYVKLLKQTPLFAATPEWQVQASMVEASLFQPLLRRRRLDIFPRKDMAPDRYFDLIPLTWTSCNNRGCAFASTRFIFEMMVISFLDFQADEFMEAVAGTSFEGRTDSLRQLIDGVWETVEGEKAAEMPNKRIKTSNGKEENSAHCMNGGSQASPEELFHKKASNSLESTNDQDEVRQTIMRFVSYIARHPSVQSASSWDRTSTLRELRVYLHAHVTQSEDNARLARTQNSNGSSLTSYFRWVRTTSADHTACPYSFAFAGCLLSAQLSGVESFPTTKAKYLAAAACQHLASMCRMYNDYGSIARDKAECNLNSVDFDEFTCETGDDAGDDKVLQTKKKTLFELAQYERSCLEDAMGRLGEEMQGCKMSRPMEVWKMFCDVTDLYGQIYVVKDIASRMTNGKK